MIEEINKHILKEYEITRKKYFEEFFEENPDATEDEVFNRFTDEITDFLHQINSYKIKDECFKDRPFLGIFDIRKATRDR